MSDVCELVIYSAVGNIEKANSLFFLSLMMFQFTSWQPGVPPQTGAGTEAEV